jgi:D-alanine-D-alanine ligase
MTTKKINKQQKKADWLKSIGPVENLESYVKADWWRHIFNANYLRTDGDVVEDQSVTQIETDLFLQILSPNQDSVILDLCCGQGRHSLELARRGFINLFGLDRSHYLINRAKAVNKKQGTGIVFREGDARKLPFSTDRFDYVFIAGNSFGYFESVQDDTRILKEIMRVLKPFGKLLIDITDGGYMKNHFQPRSWEWIDKNYFVCRERSLSSSDDRLISREVITHVKKGVIADQFYAERLYSKETITDLLNQSGFAETQIHSDLKVNSLRNQDLGMMERRIIATGLASKEWAPVRKPAIKKVAVLLGDHRKADKIKPSEVFDDDDFLTIHRLKKALAELKVYQFNYFDRHETLIQEIQKNKHKFDLVFNLCDEGFNNEATKELHIPALLDMLNICYTGGTPQCLAYCYDKSLIRGIAKEMDIPVPHAFLIKSEDIHFIELLVQFPIIVKPNFGDSSFGITENSVCYNIEQLENAILAIRQKTGYEKPILVEEFLMGKDISVGIIGNPPESYQALPIIEEEYSELPSHLPRICGYEAKWVPESPYQQIHSVLAQLPEETEQFLIASCIKLFERLECQDYARFDWRLDKNQTPRLLEVNPNPGWCWDGHLAKMANFAGLSYSQMLEEILKASEDRLQRLSRKT